MRTVSVSCGIGTTGLLCYLEHVYINPISKSKKNIESHVYPYDLTLDPKGDWSVFTEFYESNTCKTRVVAYVHKRACTCMQGHDGCGKVDMQA